VLWLQQPSQCLEILTGKLQVESFKPNNGEKSWPKILLSFSYRLSPEREEDRPSVLVFAGPNWNGAVGLCAARILATQGIRTNVCIWDYEFPLFSTELQLYRLTKQTVTRDMKGN